MTGPVTPEPRKLDGGPLPLLRARPAIYVSDELGTDYVFDTDLVLNGSVQHHEAAFKEEPAQVGENVRPILTLGTRAYMDSAGGAHLYAPPASPVFERANGATIVRRLRREVIITGDLTPLWGLLHFMDGLHTVAQLIAGLPADYRASGSWLLDSLATLGAIDISNRPVARFLHTATKKGELPGGGLDTIDVLTLVTDGDYRRYPESEGGVLLGSNIPEALAGLYKIIRSRRSFRDYNGSSVARSDFEAILQAACGITGKLDWAEREVKLRAYPSSGGLYSVEIYPIVIDIEGLEPAVYHYSALESKLEIVRPDINRMEIIDTVLPSEKEMIGGIAAMFCLTGVFPRHERKYGEGGYRMMAAEAGHISQNLILTSTALGIHARPFGGFFDDMINHVLDLTINEEQFLLSVIIGYAGEK